MTDRLTEHFTWAEAACHDGTAVPPQLRANALRLAHVLERIRRMVGGAIVPISWYRTLEYNRRVGGALHSRHMEADAADIRPANLRDLKGLIMCVDIMIDGGELQELGGYGKYPGWIHVDTRPRPADGHIARWIGIGVGSEK